MKFSIVLKKMRSEVHSKYDALKSRLANAIQRVEATLNTYIEFGDKMKQSGDNKAKKFVYSKLFNSAINEDREEMAKVEAELEDFSEDGILSFVGDGSLIESLQQRQDIGTVEVRDANDRNTPYKLKRCHDINVNVQSDIARCNTWGCCLFNETTLLVTDRSNKKLKRINLTQMLLEDYVDLPYDICGASCCRNDQVAVACFRENMIQFVTIGQTMTPSRQIRLNHICYNVSYMGNKLYVGDDTGRSVHVYDLSGKVLQIIFKDGHDNALFPMHAVHIALCTSRDLMCVTSFTGGLVYLDKKGNHITTTDDPDIAGSDGVCLDGRGNVFVAGRNSNKIVQLGYDGKKRAVILNEKDGICRPHAICFQRKGCKMCVTMDSKDIIKVFDLE